MATLAAALKQEGWHLREESLAHIVNDMSVGGTPQLGAVQLALKDADLREVGAASLPDDVNRATNKQLDGIRVLQVVSIQNVSQPSKVSGGAGTAPRLLRVRLTDGHVTATAIEYQPITSLSPDLPPGTKVALIDAPIISGVILLAVKNVRVLGGRVPALADSWDLDRKMKIILKAGAGKSVDGPRPPPFTGVHIKGGKAVVEPPAVTQSPAQVASDTKVNEVRSAHGSAGRAVSGRQGGVSQQRGEAGGAYGSVLGGRGGKGQRGESIREGGPAGWSTDRKNKDIKVGVSDSQRFDATGERSAQRGSAGEDWRGAGAGRGASGDWRNESGAPSQDSRRVQAEAESGTRILDGGGVVRPRESVRMRPGAEPYRPRPRSEATATSGTHSTATESSASSSEPKGPLKPGDRSLGQVGQDTEGRGDGVRRGGATSSSVEPPRTEGNETQRGNGLSKSADANVRDEDPGLARPQAVQGTADFGRSTPPGTASARGMPFEKAGTATQNNGKPEPGASASSGREKAPDGGVVLPQAAAPVQNKSAAMKLLERRDDEGSDGFRGGRGRGRGRGGRRRRYDDDDGDVGMTLEEWEAKKAGGVGGSKVVETDEELARRMQEQFDLEEREAALANARPLSAAEQLRQNMFSFGKVEEPEAFGGRGRGRGRGRGGGGRRGGSRY
ncbi:hypothetical protein KFL_000570470 [Klebsormidium nitens]|uniref:RecQ mediated genome instability protein 1 OB-fold domain-containing protein n=1 Tax=Klebsormidium nitens TaxID=105231 RepID=A0A0U9HIM3_KLENI|nr:hypothetical protein KFL_000570470 [Klebsormidium nitens]|eukprot:GAQ80601.1 hypothetical protein KFL_000570470 [Klebsormidium nitens]